MAAFGIRQGQALARSPLTAAISQWRGALVAIAVLSGALNLLTLASSLYMLEIYDRVLPSRSVPTLVGLTLLIVMLYLFYALFDILRGRLLLRIGGALDEGLNGRVFQAILSGPLQAKSAGEGLQPMRDLDQVRSFLSGSGPGALFDLPWIPLYLGLCFLFHFWIGATALIGTIVLVALTILTERLTKKPSTAASGAAAHRISIAEVGRRNAETVHAMGMGGEMGALWKVVSDEHRRQHQRAAEVAGGFSSTSRVLRMLLQSIVLGVGAYLVIQQEASAGVIVASSILTARALAPVDLAIGNWKGFVRARQGWGRLTEMFEAQSAPTPVLSLPAPTELITVEAASVSPPGAAPDGVQCQLRASGGAGARRHRA